MPALMASSAPIRFAMYTSSGRYWMPMLFSMPAKYSSSVQLGSTPRTGVCHVCRCVSTKPGMTMRLRASMTLA